MGGGGGGWGGLGVVGGWSGVGGVLVWWVGVVVLVGVTHGDTQDQAEWLARKVAGLRIFEDAEGKMNAGLLDVELLAADKVHFREGGSWPIC